MDNKQFKKEFPKTIHKKEWKLGSRIREQGPGVTKIYLVIS